METVILNENPRNKYNYFKRKPRRVYLNQIENDKTLTLKKNKIRIHLLTKTKVLIKITSTIENDISPDGKYMNLTKKDIEKKFSNAKSITYLRSEKFKTKRIVRIICGDILNDDDDISYRTVLEDTLKYRHFYEISYWKEIEGDKTVENVIENDKIRLGVNIFDNVNYEINFTYLKDGKRYVDYKNGLAYGGFISLVELPDKSCLRDVFESLELEIKFSF